MKEKIIRLHALIRYENEYKDLFFISTSEQE